MESRCACLDYHFATLNRTPFLEKEAKQGIHCLYQRYRHAVIYTYKKYSISFFTIYHRMYAKHLFIIISALTHQHALHIQTTPNCCKVGSPQCDPPIAAETRLLTQQSQLFRTPPETLTSFSGTAKSMILSRHNTMHSKPPCFHKVNHPLVRRPSSNAGRKNAFP